MYAVVLHEFGPAENLSFEPVPDPEPGPGQVRVGVEAAGVHLVDATLRSGRSAGTAGGMPPLPAVPGREVAGTVDAVGAGVDRGWVGRRVVAHLGAGAGGGYAQRAVVGEGSLHPLPDGLSAPAAVAMIGTGRTAIAIVEVAAPRASDVVVVTAAAGGLGALLVQAARAAGATVVGVAGGPAKAEQVESLGAIAVDYAVAGWPERVSAAVGNAEVTVALDGVGGTLGRSALELVAPGGRVVMYGFSSGEPLPLSAGDLFARGLTVTAAIGARLARRPGGLRDLETAALAAASVGAVVPLVTTFPLERAADAHRAMETRATVGKVVLVP